MRESSVKQTLLITGLPRSGTTWVGRIVSTAQNIEYVFEPDNEKISPAAWYYKRDLHRFPYLKAADNAPGYQTLWEAIFTRAVGSSVLYFLLERYFRRKTFMVEAYIGDKTGFTYVDGRFNGVASQGKARPFQTQDHTMLTRLVSKFAERGWQRPFNKQLIVKSVHTPLALDWLAKHFNVKIVLVLRNPHSLYASYKRMKMPDGNRNLLLQSQLFTDFQSYLECPRQLTNNLHLPSTMQIMLMLKVLAQQIENHPEWLIVSHDQLCRDPQSIYRKIFQQLDLSWTKETDNKLATLNQTGSGFTPSRLARLQPDKWRTELEPSEVATLDECIEHFQLKGFLNRHVY